MLTTDASHVYVKSSDGLQTLILEVPIIYCYNYQLDPAYILDIYDIPAVGDVYGDSMPEILVTLRSNVAVDISPPFSVLVWWTWNGTGFTRHIYGQEAAEGGIHRGWDIPVVCRPGTGSGNNCVVFYGISYRSAYGISKACRLTSIDLFSDPPVLDSIQEIQFSWHSEDYLPDNQSLSYRCGIGAADTDGDGFDEIVTAINKR